MKDPSSWRKKDILNHWHIAALRFFTEDIKNKKIIELGSGMGSFAEELVKKGYKKIYCTDGSKKYIEILKRKGFQTKQMDFNEKFQIRSNQFDVAVTLEVIEHLEKAEDFLKETRRILKRGVLILSTPNFAWMPYRLKYLIGYPPPYEGYHVRHFTYHSLTSLLETSGFKILDYSSLTPLPLLNRFLLKLGLSPIWVKIDKLQNMLAQDLIIKAEK